MGLKGNVVPTLSNFSVSQRTRTGIEHSSEILKLLYVEWTFLIFFSDNLSRPPVNVDFLPNGETEADVTSMFLLKPSLLTLGGPVSI